jgi:hypothetical protein
MLPNSSHKPSFSHEQFIHSPIPLDVIFYFFPPKFCPVFWVHEVIGTFMPKTVVNKDHRFATWKDNIGAPRQRVLQAVAEATVPKRLSQRYFWLCIFGSYLRHAEGSLASC